MTNSVISEPGMQADQTLVDKAWLRIGIGLAVAGQAMVLSLAINITPAEGAGYWLVHGGLMLSALAVLFFLGRDLIGSALHSLAEKKVSIDLLFLITLLGAFVGSLVSTLTHTGSVYYELIAVLVVVHTVGKMLGARSRLTALRAVSDTRQTFSYCDVLSADGSTKRQRVVDLEAGSQVVVSPGAAICVDGIISEGRSFVRETAITGEWHPVSKQKGDTVYAGSYAEDGRLVITPQRGERRLDQLLSSVENAGLQPSRLQQEADRLMAWFLPLVVGVSLATFAFWLTQLPWTAALFNAMAVLLVACPCAMGLATPVAIWGGLARLSELGLVARTGDFLEGLARSDRVCLDKTGTLSVEELCVKNEYVSPEFKEREQWLWGAVASSEETLSHPVARAVAQYARGKTSQRVLIRDLRVEPGQGLVVTVSDERQSCELTIGERSLHEGVTFKTPVPDTSGKQVWVSVDGQAAAILTLSEKWREGLDDSLRALEQLGLHVEVLTGDPHPPNDLTVPVSGGLSPQEKLNRVSQYRQQGSHVLFVGDGVNDASAMSESSVSIAMGAGSDLAKGAAMAVFTGEQLWFLPQAIRLSRVVMKNVRGNLLFASCYNIAGMILAASGKLHPVAAAFLMVGSSLIVSARSLRSTSKLRLVK